MKQPIKMTPGDELHLTALMAPFSLNLVTGQDRQHLLGYGRAAFEAGKAGQCLHQIQEPAAAEQAAWHAGLDEGRAQAAPAAVAVADELAALEDATWYWVEKEGWIGDPPTIAPALYKAEIDAWYSFAFSGIPTRQLKVLEPCLMKARAALAATPAAELQTQPVGTDAHTMELAESVGLIGPNSRTHDLHLAIQRFHDLIVVDASIKAAQDFAKELKKLTAAAPVVMPEPVGWRHSRTLTLHETEQEVQLADGDSHAQPLFTEQQVRALLAQKPAIMPKGESAAARLRAMATNYPTGHTWDKLDAKACIRGALEIEALRALLATATGLPAQAVEMPDFDLRTSKGGRGFVAWYFANVLQRYDYENYITNKLAADFACDLAKALSAALAAPQAQADARDADGMYYLQDARHSAMVGNCPSFWRPGGNGYTTNLDEAERFTFEDAMKQHRCRETDLPWLCSEVDKLRRPTVDCQYMPRSWDAQRESIAAIAAAKGE